MKLENLHTVKQTVETTPGLTEGFLRSLLFKRKENGLDKAVYKIGGVLYIDLEAFREFLEGFREDRQS
jgi:hypothetical protein